MQYESYTDMEKVESLPPADLHFQIFPSPRWDGNLRLMRRTSEVDEKEKWGDKMCLFAYDSKFKKKSKRPNLWYKMYLLSSCRMVHIPFKPEPFFDWK